MNVLSYALHRRGRGLNKALVWLVASPRLDLWLFAPLPPYALQERRVPPLFTDRLSCSIKPPVEGQTCIDASRVIHRLENR